MPHKGVTQIKRGPNLEHTVKSGRQEAISPDEEADVQSR